MQNPSLLKLFRAVQKSKTSRQQLSNEAVYLSQCVKEKRQCVDQGNAIRAIPLSDNDVALFLLQRNQSFHSLAEQFAMASHDPDSLTQKEWGLAYYGACTKAMLRVSSIGPSAKILPLSRTMQSDMLSAMSAWLGLRRKRAILNSSQARFREASRPKKAGGAARWKPKTPR